MPKYMEAGQELTRISQMCLKYVWAGLRPREAVRAALVEIEADSEANGHWIAVQHELSIGCCQSFSSLIEHIPQVHPDIPLAIGSYDARQRNSLTQFKVCGVCTDLHAVRKPINGD